MKTKTLPYALLFGLFLMGGTQAMQGQFLKKLKKKMEQKLEETVDKTTDELLNGSNTKTTTQEKDKKPGISSQGEAKTANKEVIRSTPNVSAPLKENDRITYSAPSDYFSDISIPSYQGLPKFGEIFIKPGTDPVSNYKGYTLLLELKYLSEVYSDMDPAKLTKSSKNYNQQDLKERHSAFAQRHLLTTIGHVGSENLLKEYACDPEKKNYCQFIGPKGGRSMPVAWGGNQQNDFQQIRSYTGFVKNHFADLEAWANTFFANNEQTAYYMNSGYIKGTYDFKNKGYWISALAQSTSSDFFLHMSNFLAYTAGEKLMAFPSKLIFLPLDAAKAKELKLEERMILGSIPFKTIFKIKIKPKAKGNDKTNTQFEFELESKTIELYKDKGLTQKIGELDLNNLITKNDE